MKILCAPYTGADQSRAVYKLLLRTIADTYGITAPKIQKTSMGKPFFPEYPQIHFSISHTKTHILCVVSDRPVGADIETIRPILPGVPRRTCGEQELLQFDFFDLWVLKESYIKYTGNNTVRLSTLCFSRCGNQIIAPDHQATTRLFSCIPGCRAAVCTEAGAEIPTQIIITHT